MSMSYELMMRKKEEIMYATIKGTLTENDGVFSGFSASNYLQLQQNLKNVDINEIVLKINIPSSSLNQSRYMSALYGCISITTYSGTSAFTYSVINTSGLGDLSIGTLQPDTNYWIKYVNDGTNCSAWLSEDGISFTKKSEKSSTLITETSANNYIGGSGSRYFGGSIDLNRSYIKLGSTKYKLQAVVGYTIVGSPTITDGVVSGFVMNSDYLKLAQQIETWDTNLEAKIDIITPSVAPANAEIICANGNMQQGIKLTTSLVVSYQLYDVGGTYKYCNTPTLEPNTRYTIIFKYNKQTKKMSLRVIGTNIDNTIEETLSSSPRDNLNATYNTIFFGAVNSNYVYAFTGSIDIANSYIKINNKLWFNGQPA